MADEPKNTGEQVTKSEAQTQPEPTISKAEYEKLKSELEQVKSGKDKAEGELLSPEYLAFLESREKPQRSSSPATGTLPDLESMSRKEFLEFMRKGLSEELQEFDKKNLKPIRGTVEELIAREEVRRCEKLYDDFNDYRQDMIGLLKSNEGLGIEDAYKVAKQNKKIEKDKAEREAAAKAISEKPGGPAGSSTKPADFKNAEAASEDAWERVVGNKTTL